MEEEFDVLISEPVAGFVTIAREYCNMLDLVALSSQKAFVDKAHRLLPLIYLKALMLPDFEPQMPEMMEKEVTQEEWDEIYRAVKKKTGKIDIYSEQFDPLKDNDDEDASIAEGFADIFQDLRDFLFNYDMGSYEIMNDAVWECKNNFKDFWGQRLLNIQRILHYHLYSGGTLNENDGKNVEEFDPEYRLKNRREEESDY